jgi:3-oxoacyl-[acyl-carrier protein] reductase
MLLNDKVCVITGASKGLGAAMAKLFAIQGAKVIVNYATDQTAAKLVVSQIQAIGGEATAIKANVANTADVKLLMDTTVAKYGKIDVLVNNAGYYHFQPLAELNEESFDKHLKVNFLGTLLSIQYALPHFATVGGSIINIGSVASAMPSAHTLMYAGAKAAVDVLAPGLAKELGAKNIRINTIAPGPTTTEGTLAHGIVGGELEPLLVANTALGRIGQPTDIAQMALFLATDQGQWLTGQRITVSGGFGLG